MCVCVRVFVCVCVCVCVRVCEACLCVCEARVCPFVVLQAAGEEEVEEYVDEETRFSGGRRVPFSPLRAPTSTTPPAQSTGPTSPAVHHAQHHVQQYAPVPPADVHARREEATGQVGPPSHTHTHMHAGTHVCSHSHAHASMREHTCRPVRLPHVCQFPRVDCLHPPRTHLHTRTHAHTPAHTPARTHTCTRAHTQVSMHASAYQTSRRSQSRYHHAYPT
jgi:hypothetical protein